MALLKAALLVEGGIVTIPCSFNPDKLTIVRHNTWKLPDKYAGKLPTQTFTKVGAATTSLKLHFDTTDTGAPVTALTNLLFGLMEPNPLLPGSNVATGNIRPPTVRLRWGMMATYESIITKCDVELNYFTDIGVPLRAEVGLDLEQYEHELLLTNPTSGTPRPHKTHTVQPGETLDRIAARYYGDSTQWPRLARANNVEDPLTLQPGRTISIPEIGVS